MAKKKEAKYLTLKNHPACPKCGSKETGQETDHGACYCNCNCWSHPECYSCGYRGYMNSEGYFWNASKAADGSISFTK